MKQLKKGIQKYLIVLTSVDLHISNTSLEVHSFSKHASLRTYRPNTFTVVLIIILGAWGEEGRGRVWLDPLGLISYHLLRDAAIIFNFLTVL